MGKSLGTVEYAYASDLNIRTNVEYQERVVDDDGVDRGSTVTKYRHIFSLLYILKDADGIELSRTRTTHELTDLEEMDTVAQWTAKLNDNLEAWIAEDKLELSGYES